MKKICGSQYTSFSRSRNQGNSIKKKMRLFSVLSLLFRFHTVQICTELWFLTGSFFHLLLLTYVHKIDDCELNAVFDLYRYTHLGNGFALL